MPYYPPVAEPTTADSVIATQRQIADTAQKAAATFQQSAAAWNLVPVVLIGGFGIATLFWIYDKSTKRRRRR